MNVEYKVESERVIAFRPEIAKILGSNDAAIIFQQLCHWNKYAKRSDGFIYKTSSELLEETNISERKQRKARQILIDAGWIEAEKKMANGAYTWHYRVLVVPHTVLTSRTGNMPVRNSDSASTITKKTHENKLSSEMVENVEKLYKGWLIEMVIGIQAWMVANEQDRISLLETAKTKVRLTDGRKTKMAARLDSLGFEVCAKAIKHIGMSDFHKGLVDGVRKPNAWKATIEWLFNKDEKVEEFANR